MTSEGCVQDKCEVMLVYGLTQCPSFPPCRRTAPPALSQPLTCSLASHAATLASHVSGDDGSELCVCTLASGRETLPAAVPLGWCGTGRVREEHRAGRTRPSQKSLTAGMERGLANPILPSCPGPLREGHGGLRDRFPSKGTREHPQGFRGREGWGRVRTHMALVGERG